MSACSVIVLPAVSGWAACFPCLRLSLPLTGFLAPYPPARARRALFPGGKGGFIVILCKGLRPRHPGLNLRGTGLSRGGDCLRCCLLWNRHKRRPNNRFIREKFWGVWGTLLRVPRRSPLPLMWWRLLKGHFPWNRHKRRPNNRFIREKFWGVWGTLSRVPQRFPRFPHFRDSQGLFLENILLF